MTLQFIFCNKINPYTNKPFGIIQLGGTLDDDEFTCINAKTKNWEEPKKLISNDGKDLLQYITDNSIDTNHVVHNIRKPNFSHFNEKIKLLNQDYKLYKKNYSILTKIGPYQKRKLLTPENLSELISPNGVIMKWDEVDHARQYNINIEEH